MVTEGSVLHLGQTLPAFVFLDIVCAYSRSLLIELKKLNPG